MSDEYIEMSQWSKDHWSTLVYVETVMVECGGFQLGTDARMRSNRRHVRVMHEMCPRPKRPSSSGSGLAVVMSPHHGTRLKDGTEVAGHDDWMCVQDMAEAGLFTVGVEGVEPGETLHLSPRGQDLVSQLRQHKAGGGTFASFEPRLEPACANG